MKSEENNETPQTAPPIEVSMVEDHPGIVRSIQKIIAADSRFQFQNWYQSGEEAIEKISSKQKGVLIMDLNLPGLQGNECIEVISKRSPYLKIVVLTDYDNDDYIIRSIQAGARGYLLKNTASDLLLSELLVVHKGGSSMSLPIAQKLVEIFQPQSGAAQADVKKGAENAANRGQPKADENAHDNNEGIIDILTKREYEALSLIAIGYTNSDVADEMDVSPHTLKRHIENIYQKLNVNSRSEAILKRNRHFGADI